jgi:hypothetical protein
MYCFLILAFTVMVGCGGGGTVERNEPTSGEFLSEFVTALADARGTVQSIISAVPVTTSAAESESGEEAPEPPEVQIRATLQNLIGTAQELNKSASGHASESDAQAILTDTQELLKKAEGRPNPAEIMQGLQQLSAKAEALKSKL